MDVISTDYVTNQETSQLGVNVSVRELLVKEKVNISELVSTNRFKLVGEVRPEDEEQLLLTGSLLQT